MVIFHCRDAMFMMFDFFQERTELEIWRCHRLWYRHRDFEACIDFSLGRIDFFPANMTMKWHMMINRWIESGLRCFSGLVRCHGWGEIRLCYTSYTSQRPKLAEHRSKFQSHGSIEAYRKKRIGDVNLVPSGVIKYGQLTPTTEGAWMGTSSING